MRYVRSLRDVFIVLGLDVYDALPHPLFARPPIRTSRTILSADEEHWTDGT